VEVEVSKRKRTRQCAYSSSSEEEQLPVRHARVTLPPLLVISPNSTTSSGQLNSVASENYSPERNLNFHEECFNSPVEIPGKIKRLEHYLNVRLINMYFGDL